jgi:hypothetical protein
MHRSRRLAAVLAGAFALGCADQPKPSEPADVSQPSFRTERNPEGPGALVLRSQFGAVLTLSDPDPGLTALIGWTSAELEQFCAGGEFPNRLTEFDVIRPHSTEELTDLHLRWHGTRVPLLVWETTIPFIDPGAELCGTLLLLPRLTGTGNVTHTDNDLFTTGRRGNAGHETIQGQVTSESGERFKFSERFHGVINKSHNKCCTIDLELKPIGSQPSAP